MTTVVLLQVGGIVLLIVLPAIGLGLGLDKAFGTTPFLTLLMVAGSIPLTLAALIFMLRRTVGSTSAAQAKSATAIEEKASFGREDEE